MSMSKTEAKSEALRLASEGKTHATISDHLKTKGYVGKNGQHLSRASVSQMLLGVGHRTRGKNKRKVVRRAPEPKAASQKAVRHAPEMKADKLTAVKSILSVTSMDARERIAFALLMIG